MALDAYNIAKTVPLLNAELKNGKINKATQPNKEEISLLTYAKGVTRKLVISTHAKYARIAFSDVEKENPAVAPNFCMLLRKHLVGGEILEIKQLGWERIIALTVENKNELFEKSRKILYVEIMGKYSNIVLTENDVILGALKNTTLEVNAVRPLFTGMTYTLPKKQDKCDPFDSENALKILKNFNGENLGEYIFKNFSGISLITAQEIAYRLFAFLETPEIFYEKFINFLLKEPINSCIVSSLNFTDFSACDLSFFSESEKKRYDDFLICQKDFFDQAETKKDFSLKQNSLLAKVSSHLKKLEKKRGAIFETIQNSENFEENKIKGELILVNIYKIKKGEKKTILLNYYTSEEISITLDEKLSPQENANKYYKKYNKQKSAIKYAEINLEETQKEINYLNSVKSEILSCDTLSDLKFIENEMLLQGLIPSKVKSKSKTQPFRYYQYDGFWVTVGKNNVANDTLREKSKGNDLWFHTKNYHSAFVVAKYEGKPFTDELKVFCASLCVYYSENKAGGKTEVDYTQIKKVKKPPSSRPGTVIYSGEESIFATANSQKEYEISPR